VLTNTAVPVFADVAVVAEHLKPGGIALLLHEPVEINGDLASATAIQGVPVPRTVLVDMIQCQH
jgi:hypothetical protein